MWLAGAQNSKQGVSAHSCDRRPEMLAGVPAQKVPEFGIRKERDTANCNRHHEEPGHHHPADHCQGELRTQAHQGKAAGNIPCSGYL